MIYDMLAYLYLTYPIQLTKYNLILWQMFNTSVFILIAKSD